MIDLIEIGEKILNATRNYKQKKNAEEYIDFLKDINQELKLYCEELNRENSKLKQKIEELENPPYNENHAIILKWFEDTEDEGIEENEIKRRLTNRKLKAAYYELINKQYIEYSYCSGYSGTYNLNEAFMPEILSIIDQFFPEEKPAE